MAGTTQRCTCTRFPPLVSNSLPTSGLPESVLRGQNSPSVGMGYSELPFQLEVILVKVERSGERRYSVSTVLLHISCRKNQPTSRQTRKSPKFGSLFSSFQLPTISCITPPSIPSHCTSFTQSLLQFHQNRSYKTVGLTTPVSVCCSVCKMFTPSFPPNSRNLFSTKLTENSQGMSHSVLQLLSRLQDRTQAVRYRPICMQRTKFSISTNLPSSEQIKEKKKSAAAAIESTSPQFSSAPF